MTTRGTRPGLAAVLSAIVPGLGQLYNRQWLKGLAFLLGIIVLDALLQVSSDTMTLLEHATTGVPVVSGTLLVRMLPLVGLAIWSIADAARHAKARPSEV